MEKIKNFLQKFKNKKTSTKKKRREKIQLKLDLSTKNIKKITLTIIIYSILIILIVLNTNLFKLQNINITALDENSNTFLIEKQLQYLKNKLLFKIDTKKIKNEIFQTEENLKKVDISKNYPNSLDIKLQSYKSLFKTIIKNKKYLIVENGAIIPAKNIKLDYEILILKHLELPNFFEYKKVIKEDKIKKINYIISKLKENIVNLKISKIIYYKKETEIHIIINNDTRLIFDLNGNIKEKLKQLYVFNKEKKDITKPGIYYLDNRIEGKIYYCLVEDKKQCIKNLNFIYNENIK